MSFKESPETENIYKMEGFLSISPIQEPFSKLDKSNDYLKSNDSNPFKMEKKQSKLNLLKRNSNSQNIYQIFWINDENQIFDIKLEISNEETVEDCIYHSLKNLNSLFKSLNLNIFLFENISLYDLHFAKKNGFPKTDYPPLEKTQKMSQTMIFNFCLMKKNKNKEEITSNQKIEKHDEENRTTDCEEFERSSNFICCCIPWNRTSKKKSDVKLEEPFILEN